MPPVPRPFTRAGRTGGPAADPTPTGTAVIRVVEKVGVTDTEVESGKDVLRDELVNVRRDKFFGAYMQKAKGGLKINIRQDTLSRIVGGV